MNRYTIIDRKENTVTNTCDLQVLTDKNFYDRYGSSTTYPDKEYLIENEVCYLLNELDNTEDKLEIVYNLLKDLCDELYLENKIATSKALAKAISDIEKVV